MGINNYEAYVLSRFERYCKKEQVKDKDGLVLFRGEVRAKKSLGIRRFLFWRVKKYEKDLRAFIGYMGKPSEDVAVFKRKVTREDLQPYIKQVEEAKSVFERGQKYPDLTRSSSVDSGVDTLFSDDRDSLFFEANESLESDTDSGIDISFSDDSDPAFFEPSESLKNSQDEGVLGADRGFLSNVKGSLKAEDIRSNWDCFFNEDKSLKNESEWEELIKKMETSELKKLFFLNSSPLTELRGFTDNDFARLSCISVYMENRIPEMIKEKGFKGVAEYLNTQIHYSKDSVEGKKAREIFYGKIIADNVNDISKSFGADDDAWRNFLHSIEDKITIRNFGYDVFGSNHPMGKAAIEVYAEKRFDEIFAKGGLDAVEEKLKEGNYSERTVLGRHFRTLLKVVKSESVYTSSIYENAEVLKYYELLPSASNDTVKKHKKGILVGNEFGKKFRELEQSAHKGAKKDLEMLQAAYGYFKDNYPEWWNEQSEIDQESIPDYLEVLGFSKDSQPSENEIKKAYRKMALKYHPDKHSEKVGEDKKYFEDKFKEVGLAYDALMKK